MALAAPIIAIDNGISNPDTGLASMSFLDHIRTCNAFDPPRFVPFVVDGERVGRLRRDMAVRLAGFDDVFEAAGGGLALRAELDTPERRSAALDRVCRDLGGLPPFKGERYPVMAAWGRPVLFTLDRNLVSVFGVPAYGIHVNGIVRSGDGLHLWIARRALDRAVAPGKLDNMVAGGQPAGLSLMDNLVKEAAEEADMDEALARTARPVGLLSYAFEDEWGLKPDVMFCFDLDCPPDFAPRNTDGEIADFRLMPLAEIERRVRYSDDFKYNVNLVLIDFMMRHGWLSPDGEADYVALATGLRKGGMA